MESESVTVIEELRTVSLILKSTWYRPMVVVLGRVTVAVFASLLKVVDEVTSDGEVVVKGSLWRVTSKSLAVRPWKGWPRWSTNSNLTVLVLALTLTDELPSMVTKGIVFKRFKPSRAKLVLCDFMLRAAV
jgi:hypothetical protein